MRRDLEKQGDEGIEIMGEFDFTKAPLPQLIELLHEHSVNGVILSAKHTYFEQVESVIKACELEGVEAWLVADFFGTQISRTSFDELLGRPLLVFRSTPETSWQSVVKQVMDFFGALVLLIVLAPPVLADRCRHQAAPRPARSSSASSAPASTARRSPFTNSAPWSPTPSSSNTSWRP